MSQNKSNDAQSVVISRHPSDELREALARMCDPHNISIGSVPYNLADVPAAIGAILKERPTWQMDKSWGRGW